MRRSQAPSQLHAAKRMKLSGTTENLTSRTSNKDNDPSHDNSNKGENTRTPLTNLSDHETFIRSILVKPFKVPMAGYTGAFRGRSLGIRKTTGKRSLHVSRGLAKNVSVCPVPCPSNTCMFM